MQKLSIIYGGIIGSVVIGIVILSLQLSSADSSESSNLMWLGYLVQIMAFSIIFVAIKKYRDNELGGVITFVKALSVGLSISVYATIVYVLVWEINLYMTDFAFINDYANSIIEQAKQDGKTGAELDAVIATMDEMKASYGNQLFRIVITITEIFPTGLLISLIASAILRKSEILPAR